MRIFFFTRERYFRFKILKSKFLAYTIHNFLRRMKLNSMEFNNLEHNLWKMVELEVKLRFFKNFLPRISVILKRSETRSYNVCLLNVF